MLGRQRLLRECRLHQPLAVVEISVHFDREYLVAPAGQLPLLEGRDTPLREKDHRSDRRTPRRGAADGTACIARRRNHDRERPSLSDPVEAGHEESRAEILEGAGWTVEQLKRAQ